MRGIQKGKTILALLLTLCILPATAHAAVRAEINKTSVQAGDTVELTVTVTGEGMAIAEGAFTYDPAVLTYSESAGGASDGFLNMLSLEKSGANTLSARIVFTATGAGEAEIAVSIDKVLGIDGKEQPGAQTSVSVLVQAAPPTPTPTPIDYAAKGVLAQNVEGATGAMYLWRSLENVTVPSRYSEGTLSYHGETVAAAIVEDSDTPTLVYLSNATGDAGGYYIYNEAADTLYPYQTISSVSKSYIVLQPDQNVPVPEGFTQSTLLIDEKEYPAWKANADESLFLVYARNPDGEVGYYMYHIGDQSLQRYAVLPAPPVLPSGQISSGQSPSAQNPSSQNPSGQDPAVPAGQEGNAAENEPGTIALSTGVFYALCGGAALLLLACIGLLVFRHVENKRRRQRAAARRAERERAFEQGMKR